LARGRDAKAVEVVHRIAKFNRMPTPQLSLAEFEALDAEFPQTRIADMGTSHTAMSVLRQAFSRFRHLKGLFRTK
jgi:hypothetical protein